MTTLTNREWHDKERAKAKEEGIDLPELSDEEIVILRGVFDLFGVGDSDDEI